MVSIADGGDTVGNSCDGGASSTTALADDADWSRSPTPEANANGEDKVKGMTARSAMRRARSHAKSLVVDTVFGCLARGLDAFDIFIKILGPVFMLIALALFTFQTHTFFVYVLPLFGQDLDITFQAFLTLVGVFLLVNMVYNYLKAICTDPGCPPWYEGFEEEELENGAEKDTDAIYKNPRKCKKCNRQKPPRTHHCSICKRCVLKMDHHCPWINNCVGYRNYRYFCLFLFYLAACCAFVAATFLDGFIESMNLRRGRHRKLSFDARQSVSLCWIIAVCIFFALCMLGGFHLYLVLTNQTTIEFHTNLTMKNKARMRGEYYRNPYDLGRRRNFKQVFGPHDFYSFLWAMPYIAAPPAGDGTSFPT